MKLSRDPALYLGLFAALVQLLAAFFLPLTADQQAGLNAVAVAVLGAITALILHKDGQVATVVGLAQAVIACGLNFGLHLGADQQAAVMFFVSTGAAMFVRTQVTAPTTADGLPAS